MRSTMKRCLLHALLCLSLTSAAVAQTRSYTAGENITAGDLVAADSNGKLRRTRFAGLSTEQTFSPGGADEVYPVSSSRMLVKRNSVFYLVSISSDNKLNVLHQFDLPNSLVPLDSQRFIGYVEGQSPTHAYLLTVTDSGVTFGPLAQLALGRNRIVRISATRFLTFGNGYCQMFDCSGPSLAVVGSRVACGLTWNYDSQTMGVPAGQNRVLLRGANGMMIMKINGDTLQPSALLPMTYGPAVAAMADGKILFSADRDLRLGQVSDTGITYGSKLTVPKPVTSYQSPLLPWKDKVLVYQRETTPGSGYTWFSWARASGLTLSIGPRQNNVTFERVFAASDTRVIGFYGGKVRVVNPSDTSLKLTRYLGVAEQSVVTGQACVVTVAGGVTKRFSGLSVGEFYYITEHGLTADYDQGYFPLGKAIRTDQLMVLYDQQK